MQFSSFTVFMVGMVMGMLGNHYWLTTFKPYTFPPVVGAEDFPDEPKVKGIGPRPPEGEMTWPSPDTPMMMPGMPPQFPPPPLPPPYAPPIEVVIEPLKIPPIRVIVEVQSYIAEEPRAYAQIDEDGNKVPANLARLDEFMIKNPGEILRAILEANAAIGSEATD